MSGFVKLCRKTKDHPRAGNRNWMAIRAHMLMKACWQDQDFVFRGKRIRLKPGQFVSSPSKISGETGVPPTTAERVVQWMVSEGDLGREVSPEGCLYTVTNWHEEQDCGEQVGSDVGSKWGSPRVENGEQVTPIEEEEEEGKKKKPEPREEISSAQSRIPESERPCIDGYPTLRQAIAAGENMMIPSEVATDWWLSRNGLGWKHNENPIHQRAWQSNLQSYANKWKSNDRINGQRNGVCVEKPQKRRMLE